MSEGEHPAMPRMAIGRRGAVAGIGGAAIATAGLLPRPAWAGMPTNRRLAFNVLRNDRPIGTHVLSFAPAGPRLEVTVVVDMVVKWAGIVLYRYSLRGSETWQDGVLMAASGKTNDDGTNQEMRATRRDGRLMVEGTHGPSYTAPAGSICASHWNPAQLAAPMVDLQDGRLLDFQVAAKGPATVTASGTSLQADHFALTGPATLDLWYSQQKVWVQLRAKTWEGSVIDYRPA